MTAAIQTIGGYPIYPNNHLVDYDYENNPWKVGNHVSNMAFIINKALKALVKAGDESVATRHVCIGMANYGNSPNVLSYRQGFIMADPQIMVRVKQANHTVDLTDYVILHEFGHQIQFWNPPAFTDDKTSRRRELAADCLSGALTMLISESTGNQKFLSHDEFTVMMLMNTSGVKSLGDMAFDNASHHGTPFERLTIYRYGLFLVYNNVTKNSGSIQGLTSTSLLNQCNDSIREMDLRFGQNWVKFQNSSK